jgi:putative Holliday junction resolvase
MTGPASPVVRLGGTILAFDFGLKRVGVAVGNRETGTAHPLTTISANGNAVLAEVDRLVHEWQPCSLLVGVPVKDDATEHAFAAACRRFAQALGDRFRLPVVEVDERFSSAVASLALADAGVRGIRQKPHLDAVAAQTLLQDWLDHDRSA